MNGTFGIKGIGTYIPATFQTVEEVLAGVGAGVGERRLLERIHQLRQIPMVKSGQRLEETITYALEDLKTKVESCSIDVALYAHSQFTHVPFRYDLLYKVLEVQGWEHVPCYGVDQLNCASFFAALQLAHSIFARDELVENVLLISADQSNFLSYGRYISRATIMGDSATALLLTRTGFRHRYLFTSVHSDPRFHRGFYDSEENRKAFNHDYLSNIMEGMEHTLREVGMGLEEVDFILPHNVNHTTWRRFSERSGMKADKVMTAWISQLGHTYTTDAQLILAQLLAKSVFQAGNRYMMVGVGLGCFVGTAIFEVIEEGVG
ncbi:3-oxoacyl-[acyl-carrier-protein] synthase III C-terminal domain-containing protein [Mechercharimyces sp. CAU 1602]|uniref:3-oxoacyl-[acyl-carrier-protein] synthase III C-terminal domain-containing protein n=1 Tax=Mechercharimyces sp. CAU 1602 TaxID=2973933 RepID=UPI0021618EF2|nr:3-oxoacyl-[acyl-carrier-protein] synthase III C-terminal domain-containing protein [Mechercharimyces sp. CAU 1602]MCS1352494.1 hypothetical protein [Mechercharimyces sp. CAU 1602]